MFLRKSDWLVLLLLVPALGMGCGDKRGAKPITDPDIAAHQAALGEIYEAVAAYEKSHQKLPTQVSDLKEYQRTYPIGLPALQKGEYHVVWGVSAGKSGQAVLAYQKDAPKQGGVVVLANGTITKMTADELQAALKTKG
jgi:hypothetical protein